MSAGYELARAEAKNVLVLGGGDGLAVRELLRYPAIESITLVDLDPMMTDWRAHLGKESREDDGDRRERMALRNGRLCSFWIEH